MTIAREVADSSQLLCLDELHVTDVADAMLLSRLFGALLFSGCYLLFTSNRPPRCGAVGQAEGVEGRMLYSCSHGLAPWAPPPPHTTLCWRLAHPTPHAPPP